MRFRITLAAALTAFAATAALAEPVATSVVLKNKEAMKFDFQDGSKHFVLAVRREGVATGEGPFAGASVVEFGWHDLNPPVEVRPQGYIELTTPGGDIAYLSFSVEGVFVKGAERPAMLASGRWRLVSGTGAFAAMRGMGGLTIRPAGGEDREFILDGEIGAPPGS